MNNSIKVLFYCLLLFLGVATPCTGASLQEYSNAEIHLAAENLNYSPEDDTMQASGSVEIYYKNLIILGDSAELNNKTGIAIIKGHVVIDDPGNHITAEKAVMDIRANTGKMYDAKGILASTFFFEGKVLDNIGDNRYIVHDAKITTCCEEKNPPWSIGAKRAYLHLENYAYLTLPSFSIRDIPVFYFPYFVIPIKTKRQSGFLPLSFGKGEKEGWTFENTYFWAISDSQDATMSWEYQDYRGDRFGLEYRYYLTEDGYGTFDGTYHKDYEPEDQTESILWKLKYDHNQLLPYDVQGVVHLDQTSENNPDKEFEMQNLQERTNQENDSHARLTKNWASRSLQAMVRRRQRSDNNSNEQEEVDFTQQTNSLYTEIYDEGPGLSFVNQSQQLFSTPLYFSFDLSMKLFNKETYTETISSKIDKTGTGTDTSAYADQKKLTNVFRTDSYTKLSLPLSLAPWLSVTPSGAYRITYYSRGEKKPLTATENGKTLLFPVYAEDFTRQYYDLGISISGPKFYRTFEAEKFAVKHLISPEINFSHQSKVQQEVKDQIVQFDDVDKIGIVDDPNNSISYGLTNTFLKKTEISGVQEIARLSLSQSYNIQTEKLRLKAKDQGRDESLIRPFSDIQLTLETHLIQPLLANYYTKISAYEKIKLSESVDIAIDFPDLWYFAWERRWTRVPNAPLTPNKVKDTFRFGFNLLDKLKFEVGKYYDDNVRLAHENDYALTYTSGCWQVGFDLINRRVAPAGSPNKPNYENRYFVTITLKDVFTYGKKGPLGFVSRKF